MIAVESAGAAAHCRDVTAAHRYLKRAKTSQLLHGTPAELRRLVSRRAGLG